MIVKIEIDTNLDHDTQMQIIPTMPRTNIIHPNISRAYENTSPLNEGIDAFLTLETANGS